MRKVEEMETEWYEQIAIVGFARKSIYPVDDTRMQARTPPSESADARWPKSKFTVIKIICQIFFF